MPGDSYAAADRDVPQLEQMQTDAAQTVVGNGAATEGHVEPPEMGQAECQYFSRRVRKGAAEGQVQLVQCATAADYAHDRLVGEICTVGEDQAAQVLEFINAPAVETSIGDRSTAC